MNDLEKRFPRPGQEPVGPYGELSEDDKRANVSLMALTNATWKLVNEHGFSRERVHELVDRALDA